MWWLLGGLIFTGVFWGAARRTTVNNYNETYVDPDCDGGGCSDRVAVTAITTPITEATMAENE